MYDDSTSTAKWLMVLGVLGVTAVLAFIVMRRIGEWVPCGL
jgi:hypothetical protein